MTNPVIIALHQEPSKNEYRVADIVLAHLGRSSARRDRPDTARAATADELNRLAEEALTHYRILRAERPLSAWHQAQSEAHKAESVAIASPRQAAWWLEARSLARRIADDPALKALAKDAGVWEEVLHGARLSDDRAAHFVRQPRADRPAEPVTP